MNGKFLEIPIKIIDSRLEKMNIDQEGEVVRMKINPHRVESYRESYDENDKEGISITMYSGDELFVEMSFDEFEQKIIELI